jgi:hypothetical protein
MSVLRLSIGGVSFQHRSCVAGHGPGIQVMTQNPKNHPKTLNQLEIKTNFELIFIS